MPNTSRRQFMTRCLTGLGAATCPVVFATRTRADAGDVETEFFHALGSGDVATVEGFLDGRPDLLHAHDSRHRTPFAIAHLARRADIAQLILRKGYEPDLHESALALDWECLDKLATKAPELVNRDHPLGGSVMFAAAYGGAGDQLWRVYQYGSEPNPIENANHPPPLIAALQHPDLQTAELSAATLLANGARPNPSRPAPQTPLHLAAERGSEAIVEMLIRKGAHIDARNEANVTAVEIAERRKYSAVARLLRHHRDIPRDHSTSRTAYDANGEPFRSADLSHHDVLTRSRIVGAAHFRFDEVRETVTRHPELAKAVATTTEAAVEACAHTGARPIVDFLLDHGAPYSLPTAVMRNDAQRVKELLTEDPERIHERGPHDFALLWYPVIAGGSLELAERLIKSGASVEHQHHLGTTALHWAARGGQRDMVAFLIENGADIERVGRKFNPSGETPLQTAIARNHTDIADLLKAKGAKS